MSASEERQIAATLTIDANALAEAVAAHLDAAPPSWLGVKQASAYVGISTRSLHRAKDAGELPHYRVAGRVLFNRAEIDQWVERNRVAAY